MTKIEIDHDRLHETISFFHGIRVNIGTLMDNNGQLSKIYERKYPVRFNLDGNGRETMYFLVLESVLDQTTDLSLKNPVSDNLDVFKIFMEQRKPYIFYKSDVEEILTVLNKYYEQRYLSQKK